jgi:hypothetical protein
MFDLLFELPYSQIFRRKDRCGRRVSRARALD